MDLVMRPAAVNRKLKTQAAPESETVKVRAHTLNREHIWEVKVQEMCSCVPHFQGHTRNLYSCTVSAGSMSLKSKHFSAPINPKSLSPCIIKKTNTMITLKGWTRSVVHQKGVISTSS